MSLRSLICEGALQNLEELARSSPDGCFVELGVYQGGSAQRLARIATEQGREIFLYDTFTGIPTKEPMDTHAIGDFSDTNLEHVKAAIPTAHFCVGVFPNTIVEMPPIAFVHVDADQYMSIKAAIIHLVPKMVSGGVMLFDDYGVLVGATQAVHDFLPSSFSLTSNGKAVFVKP